MCSIISPQKAIASGEAADFKWCASRVGSSLCTSILPPMPGRTLDSLAPLAALLIIQSALARSSHVCLSFGHQALQVVILCVISLEQRIGNDLQCDNLMPPTSQCVSVAGSLGRRQSCDVLRAVWAIKTDSRASSMEHD